MSKIALSGNASGTGTLTFAAQNTNSSYTLTIPNETGTLLTDAGGQTLTGGLTLGGDLTLDTNGIYLGGTGAANYLDDYEEGTWTPTLDSNLSDSIDNYDSRVGLYTKVGRLVTAICYIDGGTKGTVTGTVMRVSGLPFTPNGSPQFQSSAIGYWSNINIGTSQPLAVVYAANNFAYLFKTTTNAGSTQITPSEIGNNCNIAVTMIYHTNA